MSKRISIIALGALFALGLAGPNTVHAALVTGFLGTADTYSVWGAAGITGGATATVWGDVGENSFGDGTISGQQAGTYYSIDQSATVGVDITSAYGDLDPTSEPQTGIGVLDLDIPNTVGPGVYDVGTTATWSAALTLNGAGTYIFRGADSIAQTAGGTMILTGSACASDVYWRAGTEMTFAAAGNIEGTIITHAGITFANSALTLKGRALAEGGSVTLNNITITEPTSCSVAVAASESATIQVTKEASKKNLTSGPEKVTFTYRVTNPGNVALSDISVKDDKCDSVDYVSGDDNNDDLLDTTEEWKYTCKKTVRKTETNTVTAKGTANGEEVKDTDTAKVTVSTPGLPATGVGPADENNNFWSTLAEQMSSLFSFRQ